MIRVITAVDKAKAFNAPIGPEMEGKVLWYDSRDCHGIILGKDGNEYQFSMGRDGHIGVYTSNYVTGAKGYVLEGELVKFKPVAGLACDIRGYLEAV